MAELSRVCKCGSTLHVRVPKPIRHAMGLVKNDTVFFRVLGTNARTQQTMVVIEKLVVHDVARPTEVPAHL